MKERVIAVLLVCIILLTGGMYWLTTSQAVMTGAQNALSKELASALGSLATVGEIEVTAYNQVTIHNVAIYDKQSEIVAASDEVVVSYSPWSMLTGWNVIQSISGITVKSPTLWLNQRDNGRWNVEDLVINDHDSKASLSGMVKLVDGKAIVNAYHSQWVLEEVNGRLDLANKPGIRAELQGIYKGAALAGQGTFNSKGRSTLSLHGDQLALADFQVLMPETGAIKLLGGSATQIEATIACEKGNVEWAGEARLAKADMDLDGIPVRQVDGGIAFTDTKIYMFVTGTVFEQPLDVRGSVAINASEPILNVTVASAGFDPSVTGYQIPVKGLLNFRAEVAGIASNPVVYAEIEMAAGELAGYQAKNVQVKMNLADKNAVIHQFTADIFEGNVTAAGQLRTDTGAYQLTLNGQHLAIQDFPGIFSGSSGYLDGTVMIKGTGEDVAGAEIQGTVSVGPGKYNQLPFSSVTSRFYYNNKNATIDYLNVGIGQGMVTAQGVAAEQGIALKLYGQGIPLALVAQDIAGKIEGTGQFSGEVGGTFSAPELTAVFTAANGEILYQPFSQFTGTVQITPASVTVLDAEMINGVTRHTAKGTIGLSGSREVNMAVTSRQARAETLVPLLVPGEKLTGNVDNEMLITGTLEKPDAAGKITLTDGSFRGQLLAKAAGFYKREQGVTTIHDFVIQSLNTQIQLAGTISPGNELNFDVTAKDIDLEKLTMNSGDYTAAGKAQFKGKLTGTPSLPVFKGQLSADKLTFNQQEITGVTGSIEVTGDEVEIPALSFSQGKGQFTLYGGFNRGSNEVYGVLTVENGELQPILAAAKVGNKNIAGILNGQIKLSGTFDKPTVRLNGNLKAGSVKKYPVESITVDAVLENNVLTIYDLSARQGTGVVLARGRADLNVNGPLNLEIGGKDIDAGLVAAFFDTSLQPAGKLDFAAQVSGVSNHPYTALSLELVNGGIGDTTFDSLYGLLILDKDIINVNQILLKKGPYQASAYGMIPVAALDPGSRQQADSNQMNLNIKLDKANLSILPLLTKEVAWAEGATQGEITIGGTLDRPSMKGNVTVSNGTLKLAVLKDPIQKVGVDIAFEGDTINIKQFAGNMGSGSYRATGSAKLQGLKLADYNISLVLDKPVIRSKYFSGAVDGSLSIHQGKDKPKLTGKLLFANNIIDIPALPDMEPSQMDMDLDVDIQVGKNVRFYNPYLYDILAVGRVKVGGSLMEPDVAGRIAAIRGTVSYLRTQFKVEEGSVEFRQFSSFEPVIKLRAQTRLQQTLVHLDIDGPVGTMEFKLTSEPAMNQQEILSLLTLRSRYFDKQNNGDNGLGRDELMSALDAGLQMRFISELEGNVRNALGLDEFRFVRDTTSSIVKKSNSNKDESSTINEEVYNLEMSKYLTDKLLVSYVMGVDHNKSEVSFRYGLNRHISLTGSIGSIDKEKTTWIGAEARYRF